MTLRPGLVLLMVILAVGPAHARQVQSVGTEASFDVATWNIEWFGASGGPSDDARQLDNVQTIIESSDIDLWALQEISDTGDFAELLTRLGPGWGGNVATESGQQRVGFVYRTSVVQPLSTEHILTSFDSAFAGRPPWAMDALITLPDTVFTVTVVTLHMKAFSDLDSYSRRLDASNRMKSRFDFLESTTNLIVLGDWNDELTTSITPGQPSPYLNFVDDPDRYRFVTKPLDDAGTCTFCASSVTSTIDHIMVTDELFTASDAGFMDRHSSVITGIPGFLSTTSDHVPVYQRLVPSVSGTAVERAMPADEPRLNVWPNPSAGAFTVSAPAGARYRLVDVLGRLVQEGRIPLSGRIDASGVRSGVVVLVVENRQPVLVTIRP